MCPLCGTPVQSDTPSDQPSFSLAFAGDEGDVQESDTSVPRILSTDEQKASDCDTCGQQNPEGSRFCNRCGARLVGSSREVVGSVRAATIPATVLKGESNAAGGTDSGSGRITDLDASDRAVGKQVIIVVSAALLLVVLLYAITTISGGAKGDFSIGQAPAAEQTVEPLASQWQDREAELKADVEAASGDEQIAARRRLIDLYFAADRLDFAAEQTALIAETTGAEQDWIRAGNLYFDWMQRAPAAQKAPWAQRTVAAYQKALALNPDNLDVRTDMAIAYLYDPQNSMMGIQETNKVLAADSMHVQANFNRGIMLSQINRLDAAIEQFEKVKRIVGNPDDPVYQRAQDAIVRLSGA